MLHLCYLYLYNMLQHYILNNEIHETLLSQIIFDYQNGCSRLKDIDDYHNIKCS